MMKMGSEHPQELNFFNDEQESKRDQLQSQIEKNEAIIKNNLISSCAQSMKKFKDDNRIQQATDAEPQADENEEAEPFLVGDQIRKNMPYT